MIDYEFDEVLTYAEAAFSNKQYEEALKYYVLALRKEPDNLFALSRAGSICVVVGRYQDAFSFFTHALEVAPNIGDNYYNLGNAYYFYKEYDKCLDMYTKAEKIGCSPEVTRKMYYQKAILCEHLGDLKAALLYLNKYEKAYADNVKAMDPRVLAEKVKLHIALNDYDAAELCAAKLIMIQPTVLNNYIIYFSMLMVQKQYEKAEQILIEAEENAVSSADDKFVMGTTKAAFYIELSEVFGDENVEIGSYMSQAEKIYIEMLSDPDWVGSKNEIKIDLANLYMKAKRYDEAIAILEVFLPTEEIIHCDADLSPVQDLPEIVEGNLNFEEKRDFKSLLAEEEKRDFKSLLAEEDKRDFRSLLAKEDKTEESLPAEQNEGEDNNQAADEMSKEDIPEISDEFLERVRYILMSCYVSKEDVSKEDYLKALKMTRFLRDSQNTYYQYFSRYCEAYAMRSLAGYSELYTKEIGEQKYAETIAFYRSRMMRDPKDKYAIILRSRMYAEQGAYVKAEEMAKLLGADERDALLQYIEQCRIPAKG